MKTKQPKFTIKDFNAKFPDEDACLDFVRDMIYPNGIQCRKCQELRPHHRRTGRKQYACDYCGTLVAPLAGTIFEKSTTPLKSWFYAMFLMSSTRCGISAKQLERELGVTYKTAWRMFKQVRSLMAEDGGMLRGTVEIDETFVGGRPRHKQGRKGPRLMSDPTAKKPVVGMVERGGNVKAWVVGDVKHSTIRPLVTGHVMPETMVFTDEALQYRLLKKAGYPHRRVNHKAMVYVDGEVYTNTIEGFWSLLKNGIRGVYHSVGSGYLQTDVNEYAFRYNHRRDEQPMFQSFANRLTKVRTGQYGAYAPLG